jgi:protein SCO1/2
VVALGFGYTFCPDVCPTTLAELAQLRRRLGAAGKDFQVVYVTVDPERDTAPRLREYLSAFDPTFVGATGSVAQMAAVREAYGVFAEKKAGAHPAAYLVHHSASVYLIDPAGRLREMIPFGGRSLEDMAHDVRLLLAK